MATMNAIYVKCTSVSYSDVQTLNPVCSEVNNDWLGFILPSKRDVSDDLIAALSKKYECEVVFLSFQTVVDAFQYLYDKNGEQIRKLIYGCSEQERTWEQSNGATQPWETCLFDPDELTDSLEFAEESEREQLVQIWEEKRIEPGSYYPSVDAKQTAMFFIYCLDGANIYTNYSEVLAKRQNPWQLGIGNDELKVRNKNNNLIINWLKKEQHQRSPFGSQPVCSRRFIAYR
ncbi:MAG TPA: hypothetical protein ENG03_01245 [Thioploca sp.]|nr:hypothetical protein [Thioploca sp.]